jgi:hypothetical protein
MPVPRRQPLQVLAWVVLAHLGLLALVLLGTARVAPDRQQAVRASPLWLRLLPTAPEPSAAPAKNAATAAAPPQPLPRRAAAAAQPAAVRQPPRAQEQPALQWLPAPAAQATASSAAVPATASPPLAATSAASAAAAALRLELPRAALGQRANPALADERHRAERTTLETRIRDATNGVGDTIVEDRLADGTLKLRRGTACVLVHPSRVASIDPFNEAFSKKARGVEACR